MPILFLHGEDDPVVSVSGAKDIYARVSSTDKTIKIYPEGRHEPHNDTCHCEVVERYLPMASSPSGLDGIRTPYVERKTGGNFHRPSCIQKLRGQAGILPRPPQHTLGGEGEFVEPDAGGGVNGGGHGGGQAIFIDFAQAARAPRAARVGGLQTMLSISGGTSAAVGTR